MNQKQREYLIGRISSIKRAKIAEISKKYTVKGKKLHDVEMWNLIKSGKVKFRKDFKPSNSTSYHHDYYLSRMFDFSKFADKKNDAKIEAAEKKLEKEIRRTTDLAMLGDCEEATKLLAALEGLRI